MNQIKPLSPKEVRAQKIIHPHVIEAVNHLLKTKFNGRSASFKQKEIYPIFQKFHGHSEIQSEQELFEGHHYDFEDLYRAQGWKVSYDKPGYSESYDAYFEFSV